MPDVEKGGFVGEESFDQSAEEWSEVFGVFLVSGLEERAHGVET